MNLILIKLECMCIFKVVLDISRSKIGSVRFVFIHHFIWGSELLIAFISDWFETNDMHKLIVSALPIDIQFFQWSLFFVRKSGTLYN